METKFAGNYDWIPGSPSPPQPACRVEGNASEVDPLPLESLPDALGTMTSLPAGTSASSLSSAMRASDANEDSSEAVVPQLESVALFVRAATGNQLEAGSTHTEAEASLRAAYTLNSLSAKTTEGSTSAPEQLPHAAVAQQDKGLLVSVLCVANV